MSDIDWDSGEITPPAGSSSATDWDAGEIKPPAEPKGFGGHLRDTGLSLLKGAIAVPESVVGLADIPTGGAVGKFLENEGGSVGFRPAQAREFLSEQHTDRYKEQQREFQDADGVLAKAGVALSNPSLVTNVVTESAPSMIGGGALARGGVAAATRVGLLKAPLTGAQAAAAGAAGEGAMMAGSQASAIRNETDDRLLTPEQSGAAVATGALGSMFAYAGGRLAQRLGIGDVDTMLANGIKPVDVAVDLANSPAKSIPRKIIEGAISEGFLEELPQSVSETIIQNLALNRDWSEGVEEAAVMGTLAGMAMGGPAAAIGGRRSESNTAPPAGEVQDLTPENITPPPAPPMLALPAPVYTAGADGQVRTTSDSNAEIQAELARAGDRRDRMMRGEVLDITPVPAAPLSAQMGIDPNAGAISAAAALAVDSGASQQLADAAALQQAAEAAESESESDEDETTPEQRKERQDKAKNDQRIQQLQDRLNYVQNQALMNGGWNAGLMSESFRVRKELGELRTPPEPTSTTQSDRGPSNLKEGIERARAMAKARRGADADGSGTDGSAGIAGAGTRMGADGTGVLNSAGTTGQSNPAGSGAGSVLARSRRPGADAGTSGTVAVTGVSGADRTDNADAAVASTTPIKDIIKKTIPDMSVAELEVAKSHYGADHARTTKIDKELNRRAAAQPVEGNRNGTQTNEAEQESTQRTEAAGTPAEQATGLTVAANEAATSDANDTPAPTEAQREAGNYKKGHVRMNGHDISIENPAGSRRRPEWPPLKNHYGYIRNTIGKDKDHVDVFMTDRADDASLPVFVVDQNNRNGSFDEHKVVMGATDEGEARATYLANYRKGWGGLGAITEMSQDDFKAWVRDPERTNKPAAEDAKASKTKPGAFINPDDDEAAPQWAGAYDVITKDDSAKNWGKQIGVNNAGLPIYEAGGSRAILDGEYSVRELAHKPRGARYFDWLTTAEVKSMRPPQAAKIEPPSKSVLKRRITPLEDPRLQDEVIRTELNAMVDEAGWAQIGGKMLREDANDESSRVIGRTPWIPKAEWYAALPERLNEIQTREAVDKALSNAAMSAKEKRVITGMMDMAEARNAEMTAYYAEQQEDANDAIYEDAIDAMDVLSDADMDVLIEGGITDDAEIMRSLGFTEKEIQDEQAKRNQSTSSSTETESGSTSSRDQRSGDQTRPDDFSLVGETAEQAKSRLAQEQADQDALAERARAADRIAAADAERDSFTLTGSNRTADIAASQGQGDLLASPVAASADNPPPRGVLAKKAESELASRLAELSSEFPLQEADRSYDGISHSGRQRAKSDSDEFDSYMATANKAGSDVAKTDAQRRAVESATTDLRADYLARYRRLMTVRAGTYSGFVAGRSNLNSKQANSRNSAYDKALSAFSAWQESNKDRVRLAALAARTDDEKAADLRAVEQVREEKEQKRNASELDLMRKILSWKKGDTFPINKTSNLIGVTLDRDRYPKNIKLSMIDGSELTDDMFDVARLFRAKGASVPASKARVRELVDQIRAAESEPQAEAATVAAEPAAAPAKPASKTPSLDAHVDLMKRVRKGEASAADYQAGFAQAEANRASIVAELATMNKDQLLRSGGAQFQYRFRTDKKDVIVAALADRVIEEYALTRNYGPNSYVMSAGGLAKHQEAKANALREMVANTTDADIEAYAAEIKQANDELTGQKEARKKAVENPQTLDDFRNAVRFHMESTGGNRSEAFLRLTPEQRIRYDELEAESTKTARESAKAKAKSSVSVAGQLTDGQVIETKHTKHGHDLFVVQLAERVSREDYDTLNNSARRMGGSYSSYRGNGAVPGFQFRTRDAADAFNKLVSGDAADAQVVAESRRDVFEDDRSQSAAERLRTMGDALNERADDALNRDRKVNTSRRARMANSAENAARADKALAGTMLNLANAIENGNAKFLDTVRQKVQVEFLSRELRNAKDAQIRAKYPSYSDQEKHRGAPVDAETVDFSTWPSYTAMRSDLASLGRQMLEVDGTKKLGSRLLSVADDVSDAYQDWAKQNLLNVSRFGRNDALAEFSTKDAAERAIRRSNLTDKAIVLPIKRGVNRIVLSPSESMKLGLWSGDGDKRITLTADFGREMVEAIGRRAKGAIKLPWQIESAHDKRKRMEGIGIFTPSEYRAALREFAGVQDAIATPDKIKQMERAMIGRRNDGLDFFPTSESVVDTMLDAAEIEEGMAVLEPSAGMGHIADAIRTKTGVEPDLVELSGDRRELLEAKGYNLVGSDFTELQPRSGFTYGDVFRHADGELGVMRGSNGLAGTRVMLQPLDDNGQPDARRARWVDRDELTGVEHRGGDSGYDRIIMNPPFSKGRDIEHVRHAYDLLRPGGRLVAIMGEGAFFQSNQNAEGFRTWLDELGASSEKLPEGSFMDPSLPVNTAVNARMVVIDKPAGDAAVPDQSDSDMPRSAARAPAASPAARIDEKSLVRAFSVQHPTLVPSVRKMLERGKSGQRGGVVVLNSASPAVMADMFASKTGRSFDESVVRFRKAGRLYGFFDRRSGLTFLVGPNLDPVTAPAVLLHEMVHGQQRADIDNRALQMINDRAKEKNPELRAFLGRVAERIADAGEIGNPAEASAYIVEMAVKEGRPHGYDKADSRFLQWVEKSIGKPIADMLRNFAKMVRQWQLRNGTPPSSMSVGDLVKYAMVGLERASRGELVGTMSGNSQSAPIDTQKALVLQGEPVVKLEGNEAPTGYAAVREWAANLFVNQGGFVTNPDIGSVRLDKRAVRDSMAHGKAGPYKFSAFAAVKDVLEKGVLVHEKENIDGTTYWIAAPVVISGKDDIVTVQVHSKPDMQRMYVHAVATKEYLLNLRSSGADTAAANQPAGSSDSRDVAIILNRLLTASVEAETVAPAADPTDTPAFRRWFLGSKVTDSKGKPIAVYHGTPENFDQFKRGQNPSFESRGFYFSPLQSIGQNYAGANGRVIEAYLSINNPYIAKDYLDVAKLSSARIQELEAQGFDGAYFKPGKGSEFQEEWVAFHPSQIKSATENNGDFDPDNDDIRFSRSGLAAARSRVGEEINNRFNTPGSVSLWHKTIGTMYNLAQRSPYFKPVFNSAQAFIDDVAYYANDAAEQAPSLLPKLESWSDIAKSPVSADDNKAIAKPIFEGTLSWTRGFDGKPVRVDVLEEDAAKLTSDQKAKRLIGTDNLSENVHKMWLGMPQDQYEKMIDTRYQAAFLEPGIVWTEQELKDMFSLTGERKEGGGWSGQIGLYQEFRSSVNRSMDTMARADMLRFAGDDGKELRDQVMEAADVQDAAVMLRDHFLRMADTNPDRGEPLRAIANGVIDRADKVAKLQTRGYAPLSRFGKYTVDVVENEERQYFGLFETRAEANAMAARMQAEYGADSVSQGTLSNESYKLFAGITPESLELFGNMLGLDSTGDEARDQAFQEYLRLTKTNRSAMRRLIHRKGIAGYSEDTGRVLASFVYSNSRQTAAGLHMGDLSEAMAAIPKGQGELQDVAVRLGDYIKNPQEEGQAVRGFLFAQYLGGSVASAFVNMTQPAAVTFPWLSQFGGARKAATELGRAAKHMSTRGYKYEDDLAKALQKAEDDGVVSPQEVHQLMAQARGSGSLRSGDGTRAGNARAVASNAWVRTTVAWGKLFGAAEQVNRRVTFIASYRMARDQGMANPAEFARRAVQETQFVYSKASKMQWGRGAVGGTLMTFKTYSVAYVELMSRLWSQGEPGSQERRDGRKAAMLMIASLMLMGGAGGLPFAEDVDDVIDAMAQIAGYNFSASRAKQEFLEDLFGRDIAGFIEKGVSGLPGVPLDVSGRLGMGNLIPGTGLLQERTSHTRDVLEIVGPAGDFANRIITGARKVAGGDVGAGLLEVSPTAVRNAAKGADMAATGMYRDTKGYKVLDTNMLEAALKSIGFQPGGVAKVQEANFFNQRSKAFYNLKAQEIRADWATGIFENNPDKVKAAREAIADWNAKNPDQRMVIRVPDVMKRVREMGKSKDQRIADTAPKAMRQRMREESAQLREELGQ